MSNKMETNDKLKQDIEATLNSLDKISRAEAPPYFYTRLLSRMDKQEVSALSKVLQLLSKPVIGISVLVLFLVLNVVAIRGVMSMPKSSQSPANDAQSFATEYNLNTGSVYSN
jgi:hypothetical protein